MRTLTLAVRPVALLVTLCSSLNAEQAIAACPSWHHLTNGQTANANDVMDNFGCLTTSPEFAGTVSVRNDAATAASTLRVVNATDGTGSAARLDLAGGSSGQYSELTIAQFAPSYSGNLLGVPSGGLSAIWENTDPSHGSGLALGTVVSHPLTLGTDNAARLTITGAGNVGIGNPSPSYILDVYSGSSGTALHLNSAATDWGIRFGGGKGWIGFGDFAVSNGGSSDIGMSAGVGGGVLLGTNGGVERMRVTSGGNVGIATASPSYTLHVNGSVAGTSAYNNLSDARLKKNVTPVRNALARIDRLQGVYFDWRYPGERSVGKSVNLPTNKRQIGFLAQDLAKSFPEAVSVANDRDRTMSVAESKAVPLLVEAVKELHAANRKLEVVVRGQSAELALLRRELAAMKRNRLAMLQRGG